MKTNQEINIYGFEFLPALASNNYIEIYSPFAKLVEEHFSYKNLDISHIEKDSIIISLVGMNTSAKNILVSEIKTYLKKSRQEIISTILRSKTNGINYL